MNKKLRELLCPSVCCKFGAPLGRRNYWHLATSCTDVRVRDVKVSINSQGYDAGGAYWGIGSELRCRFVIAKDGTLLCREFYRGCGRG